MNAFNAGSNNNNYPLTVTATASGLSTDFSTTVEVTDANDAPVFPSITPPVFTEYSPGTTPSPPPMWTPGKR